MFRIVFAPLIAAALLLGAISCTATEASDRVATTVPVTENTIVLDVRTPEERAEGYLKGSRLLDFNGGEFATELSSLDPNAEYLIYCKSGNRAGKAAALMHEAGIDKVTNIGSLQDAALATGHDIDSP